MIATATRSLQPSEQAVLDALAAAGSVGRTQKEIAAATGLAPSTVSTAITRFTDARILESQTKARASRSGPAPDVVRIAPLIGVVLGLEITHTGVRAALFDAHGEQIDGINEIAEHCDVEVTGKMSENAVPQTIERLARISRDLLGDRPPKDVIGVGLAVSSPIDTLNAIPHARHGIVREDGVLRGWQGISPAEEIELALGWDRPVYADNDATLAAHAEHRWGAARGCDDAIVVLWSTGIGAGVIANGRIVRGVTGGAGELGHCAIILGSTERARLNLPPEQGGPVRCPRCGHFCLESVAGLARVRSDAGVPPSTQDPTTNAEFSEALVRAAGYVGQALGFCVNLLNPELIIVGGAVPSSAHAAYRGELLAELGRKALAPHFKDGRVMPSELGASAPLRGAAALALDNALADYLRTKLVV